MENVVLPPPSYKALACACLHLQSADAARLNLRLAYNERLTDLPDGSKKNLDVIGPDLEGDAQSCPAADQQR